MSNEPQPQSSGPNSPTQDAVVDEERANMQFMKQQLEGAKKQLKEATTTHGKYDSMTEILALQEGMSLEQAQARAKALEGQSFGIAFEDGHVETRHKRTDAGGQDVLPAQTAGSTAQTITTPDNTTQTSTSTTPAESIPTAPALDLHPEALPWLMFNGECLFRDTDKPFEGFEDELLALTSRADQFAWLRVFSFFPQLNGLSAELLRAFVRHNLCKYTRNKLIDDYLVSTGQHARHDVALGFAQITSAKVLEMEKTFPQLASFFAGAGYIGAAHESLVLLDPTCVPIIVAAFVASLVDDLSQNGIEINDWTVAYSFHPDVYAHAGAGDDTVYEVLEGLDVSLSKVKHWDQRLEYYAENDEIIAVSHQVKAIIAQLVHLTTAS